MTARLLAWYTCGVLSLASLLHLFATVAPGAEAKLAIFQAVLGGAAFGFAVIAVVLSRLPTEHWCNRSLVVRGLLSVAAVSSSLLMIG